MTHSHSHPGHNRTPGKPPSPPRSDAWNAEGSWAQRAEELLPTSRLQEEIDRSLAHGLEAAESIGDRSISTFVRGELPHFAGETGTFLK